MRPTIRLILVTALRDRFFLSLYALLAGAISISAYLGGLAMFEPSQTTVVYAAGSARVLLVLAVTVFIAFHIERLYDTREIEAILSRSLSRPQFVIALWFGLVLVALALVVPIGGVIYLFNIQTLGTSYWCASLVLEIMIMAAFVLFSALTFERAIPTIFATVGFYALARVIGLLTSMTKLGQQGGVNTVTNPIADAISLMVPRLDLFAQSRWLVYGPEASDNFHLVLLQAAIYVPLLISAAIFDLRKKQF
jgi:ABC-type transport system involved in multi-copper enzyme maturation permease subunit